MAPHTPEECDALFAQHVQAGELDALVALYEPNAALVQQDGSAATGHAAIREGLAGFVALRPSLRMNVLRVVRAADDLAVLYNDWSGSATAPDGSTMTFAGRAVEIVRRQSDGSWRFAIDDPWARG